MLTSVGGSSTTSGSANIFEIAFAPMKQPRINACTTAAPIRIHAPRPSLAKTLASPRASGSRTGRSMRATTRWLARARRSTRARCRRACVLRAVSVRRSDRAGAWRSLAVLLRLISLSSRLALDVEGEALHAVCLHHVDDQDQVAV